MSLWGKTDVFADEPKFLASNTDVFLVDTSRLANATFGNGEAVSHQGWVKINQGSGFVQNVEVSNVNPTLTYANAYLSFSTANTSPANGQLIVLNGNNVSISLNAGGVGFEDVPVVTAAAAGSNNASLIFTVVPGGRMGRVSAETLVALSDPSATDANTGGTYFPGV